MNNDLYAENPERNLTHDSDLTKLSIDEIPGPLMCEALHQKQRKPKEMRERLKAAIRRGCAGENQQPARKPDE